MTEYKLAMYCLQMQVIQVGVNIFPVLVKLKGEKVLYNKLCGLYREITDHRFFSPVLNTKSTTKLWLYKDLPQKSQEYRKFKLIYLSMQFRLASDSVYSPVWPQTCGHPLALHTRELRLYMCAITLGCLRQIMYSTVAA